MVRSFLRLRRVLTLSVVLAVLVTGVLHWWSWSDDRPFVAAQYPRLTEFVSHRRGRGGAWYIPPDWGWEADASFPATIVEAAEVARNRSMAEPQRQMPHSVIPLILHQTWKNTYYETWPPVFRQSAERWLHTAENSSMAYFLWDDEGIAQFIRHFEPDFERQFYALPSNVERSDVFRILVCKWIGGIYGDMDTEPTKAPVHWINATDLLAWHDPETGVVYDSSPPVRALVGLEADCPPDSDAYWRMGYAYPIQLTQWSFAWAPGHPILQRFIDNLSTALQTVVRDHQGQWESDAAQSDMYDIDPLVLTGPVAFTSAVREGLEAATSLRWNALTGLEDGGASKLVGDVLVLPITGFSPGRGKYGNMGSKPITDPSARLLHHAQGSWRKSSLRVEYGKFCRTVFGLCRDWSKVPHSFIS